jgi:hypothetical protein
VISPTGDGGVYFSGVSGGCGRAGRSIDGTILGRQFKGEIELAQKCTKSAKGLDAETPVNKGIQRVRWPRIAARLGSRAFLPNLGGRNRVKPLCLLTFDGLEKCILGL